MGKSSILLNTPRFFTIREINENSPNWFKQHSDNDYTEIIYFQQGCGEFFFEEKPFIGQEGDLIILHPFSPIKENLVLRILLKGFLSVFQICISMVTIKAG